METMTLEYAQTLIQRTIAKAGADYGRPMCVAVCDPNGYLIAFARMDGGPLRSIKLSQQKAYTAVRMGINTDAFLTRIQTQNLQPIYYCDPLLTPLPGGNLLKNKAGKLIGGVGVSGLAPNEDQALTEFVAGLVGAE